MTREQAVNGIETVNQGPVGLAQNNTERVRRRAHKEVVLILRSLYFVSGFIIGLASLKKVIDKDHIDDPDLRTLGIYAISIFPGLLNALSHHLFATNMQRATNNTINDTNWIYLLASTFTALTPAATIIRCDNTILSSTYAVRYMLAVSTFLATWPIFYEDFAKFVPNLKIYKEATTRFFDLKHRQFLDNVRQPLEEEGWIKCIKNLGGYVINNKKEAVKFLGMLVGNLILILFPLLGIAQSFGYVGVAEKVASETFDYKSDDHPHIAKILFGILMLSRCPFIMETYNKTQGAWNQFETDDNNSIFHNHKIDLLKAGLNSLVFAMIIYANSSVADSKAWLILVMTATILFGSFGRLKNILADVHTLPTAANINLSDVQLATNTGSGLNYITLDEDQRSPELQAPAITSNSVPPTTTPTYTAITIQSPSPEPPTKSQANSSSDSISSVEKQETSRLLDPTSIESPPITDTRNVTESSILTTPAIKNILIVDNKRLEDLPRISFANPQQGPSILSQRSRSWTNQQSTSSREK